MLSDEEQQTLVAYNQIAEEWAKTQADGFWLSEYKTFAGYLPTGKIIDLGCGAGRDCKWFLVNGYKLIGIDISPKMIELAKSNNPQGEFFVKSFYQLGDLREKFDGFWAACSFLHVPKEKIADVIIKVKQLLNPGAIGFIAIKEGGQEKSVEWQNSGQKRFFFFYSQDEFAHILTNAGFEILKHDKRPPGPKFPQDGTFLTYFIRLI